MPTKTVRCSSITLPCKCGLGPERLSGCGTAVVETAPSSVSGFRAPGGRGLASTFSLPGLVSAGNSDIQAARSRPCGNCEGILRRGLAAARLARSAASGAAKRIDTGLLLPNAPPGHARCACTSADCRQDRSAPRSSKVAHNPLPVPTTPLRALHHGGMVLKRATRRATTSCSAARSFATAPFCVRYRRASHRPSAARAALNASRPVSGADRRPRRRSVD